MTGLNAPQAPGSSLDGLAGGFEDPVFDAQACFRAVLDAMARPGRIATLPIRLTPPAPLSPAAAAMCLTLLDHDTPLWRDPAAAGEAVAAFLRFHTGAPLASASDAAAFALIADAAAMPPLSAFDTGDDAYPDRAATLIVEVAGLGVGDRFALEGPGIDGKGELAVVGLPPRFWAERERLTPIFPRGIDVVLTHGEQIAALPRTAVAAPA